MLCMMIYVLWEGRITMLVKAWAQNPNRIQSGIRLFAVGVTSFKKQNTFSAWNLVNWIRFRLLFVLQRVLKNFKVFGSLRHMLRHASLFVLVIFSF